MAYQVRSPSYVSSPGLSYRTYPDGKLTNKTRRKGEPYLFFLPDPKECQSVSNEVAVSESIPTKVCRNEVTIAPPKA